MESLGSAVLVALVVKTLLDRVAEPLRTKFPQLDLWWFDWVALLLGGVVAWFAGFNLFAAHFSNEVLGRILTACAVGGGANVLNQLFSNAGGFGPAPLARDLTGSEIEFAPERPRGW